MIKALMNYIFFLVVIIFGKDLSILQDFCMEEKKMCLCIVCSWCKFF